MKTKIRKRLLSGLLSLVMVLSLMTNMDLTLKVEAAPTSSNFITMPITIRDYAADGMLFEFNQVGATGTVTAGEATEMSVKVNPSTFNNDNYSWICVFNNSTSKGNGVGIWWQDIYVNADGTINRVYPAGTPIEDTTIPSGGMYIAVHSNCTAYYSTLTQITNANKSDYRLALSGTTLTMVNASSGKAGTYNQADTAGFSLLSTGDADFINDLPRGTVTNADNPSSETTHEALPKTTLIENGYWGLKTDPAPISVALNSGAPQQVYGSWIRTDLVEGKLDAEGKPVYIQEAVDYLAKYMQQIFAVPYQTDGVYNTYYVMGVKMFDADKNYVGPESPSAVFDLADIFRGNIPSTKLGNYTDAKSKFEAGNLTDAKQATTWYEAAYFLLHNTWRDSSENDNGSDGYGMPVRAYKDLHLVQTTNAEGNTCFVFNSKYDNTEYDYQNGEIYNTQTTDFDIAQTKNEAGAYIDQYVRGNALPAPRFDPLGTSGAGVELGYGISGDTYGDLISDSTAAWADYYDTTNYHLSLEGHAKFIYYHDDNLYFTFTGDDDVYLFINGIRVLDMGAAHSISKVKINLNDVAEICELQDGQAYDFDFFYMERHGTAANFGIETNIKIVNPAMLTQKTGYQNGVEVGYNGFVDPQQPVNYCFQLTNNGEAPLKTLEFKDEDIDVSITSAELDFNNETVIGDLLLAVYNADGSIKQYVEKGKLTEDALKTALAEGIDVGERILIHGFKYTIPDSEWVIHNGSTYFNNTVYTTGTAHYQNAAAEELHGIADYRVQKQTYSFAGDHFYTLGRLKDGDDKVTLLENSTITGGITYNEILEMIKAGKTDSGDPVSANSFDSLQICSASGNTTSNINPRAVVNGKTITYSTPFTGTDSFYFLATSGEVTYGPIRVVVYNYGYADNAYVLDYNLPVELNGTSFGLTTNDQLNVDNAYITSRTLEYEVVTDKYGTFTLGDPDDNALEACYNGQSFKYTMKDFMSDVDAAKVTLTLKEAGVETPDNRTNGVMFTENVEVVPASVVYYEDDFVGITYVNSETDADGNVWAEYEGANGKGKEQSADQNSNYGSDPNYKNDKKWGKLQLKEDKLQEDILKLQGMGNLSPEEKETLKEIMKGNKETGAHGKGSKAKKAFDKYKKELDGTASNGTIHELILSPGSSNSEIMYFDFQGTGFELISRATQDLYAVLNILVFEWNEEGTIEKSGIYYKAGDWNGDDECTRKNVPVITESQGGDAYEVPIIKIEDLPYSKYRVALYASNVSDADREIYVDGVRIYEPLNDELEDVYYSTDEADAGFQEIRPLVLDETIVYLDLNDSDLTWGTGTTVVEDLGNDETNSIYQAASHGTTDYMLSGPNNEIYLDATAAENTPDGNASLLAFYVTRNSDVAEEKRTLQIGAHRKINTDAVQSADGAAAAEDGAVYLVYGSTAEDIANGILNSSQETLNWLAIESGTEQYITIDSANLEFDADGKALVMVGTNGGENAAANILALTNLKISGYTLVPGTGEQILDALNGNSSGDLITTGYSLRMLLAAPAVEVEDEAEGGNPDISEPEDELPDYSGSDEEEPDDTKPEESEPGETVPDDTEPDDTDPEESKPGNGNNKPEKPGKPGNGNNKPGKPGNNNKPAKPGETEPDDPETEESKPGNGNNKPSKGNNKPGKTENNKPAKSEKTEPVETKPVETETAETESKETEAAETETVETEAAETETVETEVAETETVETETAETGYEETEAAETEPVETEPEETEPKEELLVHTAGFLSEQAASGSEVLLYAVVSNNAETLKILDESGNEISFALMDEKQIQKQSGSKAVKELLKKLRKEKTEDAVLMILTLNIEGESGQERTFRVYGVDTEDGCSEESQSVTITIE